MPIRRHIRRFLHEAFLKIEMTEWNDVPIWNMNYLWGVCSSTRILNWCCANKFTSRRERTYHEDSLKKILLPKYDALNKYILIVNVKPAFKQVGGNNFPPGKNDTHVTNAKRSHRVIEGLARSFQLDHIRNNEICASTKVTDIVQRIAWLNW